MRALRIARHAREMLPDFLGGEHDDRRREAQQSARDAIHGGLRRAPRAVSRRKRVEPVLEHVEIKRAQVHDGEIVQRVEDAVKFKCLVPLAALPHQLRRA